VVSRGSGLPRAAVQVDVHIGGAVGIPSDDLAILRGRSQPFDAATILLPSIHGELISEDLDFSLDSFQGLQAVATNAPDHGTSIDTRDYRDVRTESRVALGSR
jgi:hypothetical protein